MFFCCVPRQVEVSATSWPLVQEESHRLWRVVVCDHETSCDQEDIARAGLQNQRWWWWWWLWYLQKLVSLIITYLYSLYSLEYYLCIFALLLFIRCSTTILAPLKAIYLYFEKKGSHSVQKRHWQRTIADNIALILLLFLLNIFRLPSPRFPTDVL
jgi:hypothetical protein